MCVFSIASLLNKFSFMSSSFISSGKYFFYLNSSNLNKRSKEFSKEAKHYLLPIFLALLISV